MIGEDSDIIAIGVKTLVQGFMMDNSGEACAPLIAQLRRDWKSGEVSFAEVSKAIITYTVNVDKPTKTLHVRRHFINGILGPQVHLGRLSGQVRIPCAA